MNIDRLNCVQKCAITYTPTQYAKKVDEENESKSDTLTLTDEARQFLAAYDEGGYKQKSTGSIELDILRRQLEGADKSENKVVNITKCFKIARRIQNGDKVPLKDMKFLQENAPELYKNALLFKKQNPEPKKYKTCLDKEDEEAMSEKNASMLNVAVGADDAIVLDLNA